MVSRGRRPWRLFSWPRVGVVDVGSNAIRTTVAVITDREIVELKSERFALRLGKDVFNNGRTVSLPTQANLIDVFSQIKKIFAENKVDIYRAVATSALRSARNRKRILKRITSHTGLELELIAPSEEERLIGHSLPAGARKGKTLLMDLGGGSLEIGFYDKGKLEWMTTFPFGAVRLLGKTPESSTKANFLCNHIAQKCQQDKNFRNFCNRRHPNLMVIGSGGNIRALYRVSKRLLHRKCLTNPKLSRNDILELIQKLEKMSPRQRHGKLKLPTDRADVILPAAYVFHEILCYLGADTILIPTSVSLRKGMLLDLKNELFA